MTSDDLKRIFLGPTLFRLDTILSPRLVPVVYVTGLGAILIWAIKHLFATFGTNFGEGLWGLLEIAVFGAFMLVVPGMVTDAAGLAVLAAVIASQLTRRRLGAARTPASESHAPGK